MTNSLSNDLKFYSTSKNKSKFYYEIIPLNGVLLVWQVVWNLLLILTPGHVSISQVIQKSLRNKKTTRWGWKEEQINTDSELQNVRRWSWYFLAFYVCSWLSWELCENPTQLPKMLTHLVIVFTAQCPASDIMAPCPGLELSDSLLWSLTPNWLLWSLTSDWLRPLSCILVSQVFMGISLCVVFVPK